MPPGISVAYGLEQVLPDGTRMHADVYTPDKPGRYPTLLMRLPYGTEIASSGVFRHPAWYASRGFTVAVQEVRGTGRSGGSFYPLRDELPDTLAAIEWAAALSRSNGRVGMYGFSYQGAVQLQAAAARPNILACIAPSMTAAGFYHGWHYEGGVPLYGSSLGWALQLAAIRALHDGRDADLESFRAAAANPAALYATAPLLPELLRSESFVRDWFAHECEDGYWQGQQAAPAPDVPGLWSAGWYDTFLDGTLRAFAAARAPDSAEQSILIGPWQHMPWSRTVGGRDFGEQAWSPLDDVQAAFFDRHLRGCSPREPFAVAFVTGLDGWRSFAEWPPPVESTLRLYLSSDGDAGGQPGGRLAEECGGAERFDVFVSEPLTPVAALGGHGASAGCFEQSPVESRREVLTYTTGPLERDTLVAGPLLAWLSIAASGGDCDWVARLCDVDEQGRSFNVTQGALRGRFRNGFQAPEALRPDACERVAVPMRQCCHLFRAGHRIRLAIAGSSFPHYGRNPGVCEPVFDLPMSGYRAVVQYVVHGQSQPSCLELPILSLAATEPWAPEQRTTWSRA
jgi:putative CocE/NonD family hydrolase